MQSTRLCYNCLGHHYSKSCKNTNVCYICKSKHHTLLHDGFQQSSQQSSHQSVRPQASQQLPEHVSRPENVKHQQQALSNSNDINLRDSGGNQEATMITNHNVRFFKSNTILLGTALVAIQSNNRTLIDPGSEVSIISQSLARSMHLP